MTQIQRLAGAWTAQGKLTARGRRRPVRRLSLVVLHQCTAHAPEEVLGADGDITSAYAE